MSGYIDISGRTTDDDNSNGDVNQLMENIRLNRFADYVAGASISSDSVVTSDGLIADNTNPAHKEKILGIANEARSAAQTGMAQVHGERINNSWAFTPNAPVYLNGTYLSSTKPTTGFVLQIGIALSATKITVRFERPVEVGTDNSESITSGVNVILNEASAKRNYILPTANINVILEDDFDLNDIRYISNESGQYLITLLANDASEICKIIPKSWLWIRPNTALPADSTEWTQTDAGGSFVKFLLPTSNGFGAISDPGESLIRRDGGNAVIILKFQVGNPSASEAQAGIPFELLTADSNLILSSIPVSNLIRAGTSTFVTAFPSVSYLNFGDTATANQNGTQVTSTNEVMYGVCIVPIDGWQIG